MPTRFEKRNWAARSCLLHLLSFVNGLFRPGSKLANAFQLPFLYHKFVHWALEAAAAASGTEGSVSRRAHRHQDREGEPASAAAAIHSPDQPGEDSAGLPHTARRAGWRRRRPPRATSWQGNQNRAALLITLRVSMSCFPKSPGGLQLPAQPMPAPWRREAANPRAPAGP